MIFEFLKYVKPFFYFNLKRKSGNYIYPKVKCDLDYGFETNTANSYYESYLSVEQGRLSDNVYYQEFETLSTYDNYQFIRLEFHRAWSFYILALRILSLKNPIKELRAFIKTQKRKEKHVYPKIDDFDMDSFEGLLIKSKPFVSVIIPTLNRYTYLKDVLKDLESQYYDNFEVIIVDQSDDFQIGFYKQFDLNINLIRQEEKALWKARNSAIMESKGEYVLLFDDDSRVDANWIEEHLNCLDFFQSDVSSGVSISQSGARVPINYSYFKVSDQLDTGNAMIKKHVFQKVGLFDRQFEKQRMGDGEFGLRVFLNDLLNIQNCRAKRLHLKVGTGGLREMGAWDAFRTKGMFKAKPIPSVLYLVISYFGYNAVFFHLLKNIPLSLSPYKWKDSFKGYLWSLAMFFILPFLWIIPLVKSLKKANAMIEEGPKIDYLAND